MAYGRTAEAEPIPSPVDLPWAPFPYSRHCAEFGIPARLQSLTLVGTPYLTEVSDLYDWVTDMVDNLPDNLLVLGEGHIVRPVVSAMVQDLLRQPSHRRLSNPGSFLRWTTPDQLRRAVSDKESESLVKATVVVAELPRPQDTWALRSLVSVVESRLIAASHSTIITADPEVYEDFRVRSPEITRKLVEGGFIPVYL